MVPVWDFISGTEWRPNRNAERGEWGVLPLVSATLTYAFIAMCVAVPIGLMTAIYLERIRAGQCSRDLQASSRDTRRCSNYRLWVFCADISHTGSPSTDVFGSQHLQRPICGTRNRHLDDPACGVVVGRCACGGAIVSYGKVLTRSARQSSKHRCAWSCPAAISGVVASVILAPGTSGRRNDDHRCRRRSSRRGRAHDPFKARRR